MNLSKLVFVAAGATVWCVSACTFGHHQQVGAINPQDTVVSQRWMGTLSTPSGLAGAVDVKGIASLTPAGGTTVAKVSISNAPPGGLHPWQIEIGACSDSGAVIGSLDTYPPLKVGDDGNATATVTLAIAFPTTGAYSVKVYAAPTNLQTVLACGNLAPPNKTS